MKENLKRAVFRCSKLLHFAVTVLLFGLYYISFVYGGKEMSKEVLRHGTMVLIYGIVALFSLRAYSSYNVGLARIRMLVYSQTLANILTAGILYVLMVINRLTLLNPLPLLGLVGVQFLWNILWSLMTNALYFKMFKPRKTVLVYHDAENLKHLEELKEHPRKFQIIKTIEDPADDIHALIAELEGAEAVFVAGIPATLRNGILKYCIENSVRCYVAPHVGDVLMLGSTHVELFSIPVCRVMRAIPNVEYAFIKRTIDIVASLLGIVLCSPFMLITALAIKLQDGGPVLYKQVRLTKDGKHFKILKFRSMRVDAERDGVARLASENDNRITPVGKVIRACRLDELPQLFNILMGDMTIVGPRPERPEIAKQYEEFLPAFGLRLQVKAGLTGLAQVYGKYNSDPYDKLRMDLMYVNNMSLLEDIKLMFATVKVLFMKESTSGIADGQTTASAKTEDREYAVK